MSRQAVTAAIGCAVWLAGAAGAGAQTVPSQAQIQAQVQAQIDQIRTQIQTHVHERIVVSQDLVDRINQIIQTTVGAQVAQDLSRELGRTARDIGRSVDSLHAVPGSAVDQNRNYTFEQTNKETKTLAIGANGDLNLKNIVGDITVKAGSGRDVTVEITRVAKGKTDADAKLGLEKVVAEVSTSGQHGSVTARYPNDLHPNYAVSVAYNVTAPAGTRVTIESISSRVVVTGMQGEVDANTISGAIDCTSCARVGTMHTVSGNITLTDSGSDSKIDVGSASSSVTLTNIKAPRVSASVISGRIIAHGIQTESASLGSLSGDVEFSGTVVAKGRYEFNAHSGNVRLALTGGFDLEGKTFSGTVEADPALNLTTTVPAGSNKRSLRGTSGGGGAAVVATTFSGNVWVGKTLGK